MKKLIRNSVFETNSSSSHSISLAKSDMDFIMDTIFPDEYGNINVIGGEFGWEWVKYNDAITKLNYAYQDNVDVELLRKIVLSQTGADRVIFHDKDDGYIDHDSVGNARNVCVDEESTRNFIFNLNSWLFTGNDNTNPHINFFDVPKYTEKGVINPVYRYELSINGINEKIKLTEYPNSEKINEALESLAGDINFKIIDGELVSMPQDSWSEKNDYIFDYNSEIDYENGQIRIYNVAKFYELRRQMLANSLNTPFDYDLFKEKLYHDPNNSISINYFITEI
jgi:hypothetical protein